MCRRQEVANDYRILWWLWMVAKYGYSIQFFNISVNILPARASSSSIISKATKGRKINEKKIVRKTISQKRYKIKNSSPRSLILSTGMELMETWCIENLSSKNGSNAPILLVVPRAKEEEHFLITIKWRWSSFLA